MPQELWLDEPYKIDLRTYAERPLAANAVRARGVLSAISHGTEISHYRGTSPFQTRRFDPDLRLFVDAAQSSLYPVQLGYEWVGRVVEVGTDVSGYQPGDLVHLPLPHRQTHTFEPEQVEPLGVIGALREPLQPERAVFLATTSIALQAVHDAQIKVGDHVLILGLGVLGLITVKLAAISGASWITAVDPISSRRQRARALGADNTLDPGSVDVGLRLRSAGRGADTAIEFSGSYGALQQAVRSVCRGGLVVAAGFYQGPAEQLNLGEEWLHNRVTMVASSRGWGNTHRHHPLWNRARVREAAQDILASGEVRPETFISHRFPFSQAAEAFELIDKPPVGVLKVVLDYEGEGT